VSDWSWVYEKHTSIKEYEIEGTERLQSSKRPPKVRMALSTSTSIQGQRVDILFSPIDPLSMESYHFFTIFTMAKTIEMQDRERTTVQNIEKW
jgi:hypothetical protein